MLNLMIYAPCEKVIIGNDDTASIISMMETIKINTSGELPPEAFAPIRWSVLSLWRRDQQVEQPIDCQERTEVVRPDGSVATGGTTNFTVTNAHLMYRSLLNFPVFPIGQPGIVWVKGSIRQLKPETEWVVAAEFPLLVIHEPLRTDAEAGATPKETKPGTTEAESP